MSGFRAADVPLMGEYCRALYSGRDQEAIYWLAKCGLSAKQALSVFEWDRSREIIRSRRKAHAARFRHHPSDAPD